MTFYHNTLHRASGITHALCGDFCGEEKEEIVVSAGKVLKLLRLQHNDVLCTLIDFDMFEGICALSKFRRKKDIKDLIVISTFSGKIVIISVDAKRSVFKVFEHIVTEPKAPRKLPVQHLTVDPYGRAILFAAIEAVKCLWLLSSTSDQNSSPILDASTENTLIFDVAFLDINSENLIFVCLEIEYMDIHSGLKFKRQRQRKRPDLVFYEVTEVDVREIKRFKCLDHANSLIAVPNERAVLVCAEDLVALYLMDSSPSSPPCIVCCPIPKRTRNPKSGVIFVCSTKYNEIDSNNTNCYLAQTEEGDIFKIQLIVNEKGENEIIMQYFITLPVSSSLCALESGFLFVAFEFGDHQVFRISDLENNAKDHPLFSSALSHPNDKPFVFDHVRNVEPITELKSLSPVMHMECAAISSKRHRLCLATGKASLSTLKISKIDPDVIVKCCKKIDKIDETPFRVWVMESTKSISEKSLEGKEGTLIIVSFEFSTSVYLLDRMQYAIHKIAAPLFATQLGSLGCARTGTDAIIQVCPEAVCLITNGMNQIKLKAGKKDGIQDCAMNRKALIIACENKLLKLYKIDTHGLLRKAKVTNRLLNGPVACMILSDRDEETELLAVGILPTKSYSVNQVHLFIVSDTGMDFYCMFEVKNAPFSMYFMHIESDEPLLFIGCKNGILLTLLLSETIDDEETMNFSPTLTIKNFEILGTDPVLMFEVPTMGKNIILTLSDKSWYKETIDEKFMLLKSNLSRCTCVLPGSEDIITIMEDSIRILTLDLQKIPPVSIPLECTPKNFIIASDIERIFVIETDLNSYTEEARRNQEKEFEMQVDLIKAVPKLWTSHIRIINVSEGKEREVFKLSLKENEAALSLCLLQKKIQKFLLVGVAKDYDIFSDCSTETSIYTYRIPKDGQSLKFLHKTFVVGAPLAMCNYKKNVLIATGKKLAYYCLEPRSLELRLIYEKNDCVSNAIKAIYPIDKRILVRDKYGIKYLIRGKKRLHILEDDISSELTAACSLSNNQMVRAYKSGDICICQLGNVERQEKSKITIACSDDKAFTLSKETILASFHVGEVILSMQKINNIFSGEPMVIYTTLSGSIGILSSISSEDSQFVNSLNSVMREMHTEEDTEVNLKKTNLINLALSSNSDFRSWQYKLENVVDGDFLSLFHIMGKTKQKSISEEMAESVNEISERLQTLRRQNTIDFQF